MKEEKSVKKIWTIMSVIGFASFLLGTIICFIVFNYDNMNEIEGEITEISLYKDNNNKKHYDVYVSYNVNGKEYNSKLYAYASSFYEGKKIKIFYDIDNPRNIRMPSFDYLYLIMPCVGIIFLLIGRTGLLVSIIKKKNEEQLKLKGEKIYANYIETGINFNITVNGRHPYYIICEWIDSKDNKRYLLKSKNIWINPEKIIADKNIKMFTVYMDMKNKKKYFIDIADLYEDYNDLR